MSTARPSLSQSGIRQFGYSSHVPGMFCVLRSPTASTSATPVSTDGVSARYPYRATVMSLTDGSWLAPAGSSPSLARAACHLASVCSSATRSASGLLSSPSLARTVT